MKENSIVLVMHPLKIVRTAIKSMLGNSLLRLTVYEHAAFEVPLPLYNGQLPNLLITDVYYEELMPVGFMPELVEKYKGLKMIATSSQSFGKDYILNGGHVIVLSKKVSEQELVSAVNKLLL
jgi:DNA-binding NarL/FixJ family response regulator